MPKQVFTRVKFTSLGKVYIRYNSDKGKKNLTEDFV